VSATKRTIQYQRLRARRLAKYHRLARLASRWGRRDERDLQFNTHFTTNPAAGGQ